tara:strand:- start:3898 stop:4896 length:999 start_codon:yes stop_codon:yes gene_type:complete
MKNKWDILISEFCRLGGIAENICQKDGENGRGIFPLNKDLKSRIFTPYYLMIHKKDICLENNKIRIKKEAKYDTQVREFFIYYQDNFSWGGGGRETTEFFEKSINKFNYHLKELISQFMLVDIHKRHEGNWQEIILRQFIQARLFKFKNSTVICPLLELVNHEVISLPFITNNEGISTPNYPPLDRELTHNYSNKSAIQRFFLYGFFCKETIVFSFPFSMNLKDNTLKFLCKGNDLVNDSIVITRSDSSITIEGLPIADSNSNGLPLNYLSEIFERIDDIEFSNDFLLEIIDLNIKIRNEILKNIVVKDNNVVVDEFRKLINYEISLISSCN